MTTTRHADPGTPDTEANSLEPLYVARRTRVDAAYARMRTVVAGRHTPADTRRAASELTAALLDAGEVAVRALRLAEPVPSRRRFRLRAVRATRSLPPEIQRWSIELVRLSEIEGWLRRTTMDELGVDFPAAVRVGSRAASGPHIAGLVAEPDDLVAATLHQPRIGVDLQSVVDGIAA